MIQVKYRVEHFNLEFITSTLVDCKETDTDLEVTKKLFDNSELVEGEGSIEVDLETYVTILEKKEVEEKDLETLIKYS